MDATLTYRIRYVANGGYTTFSESDDVVQFQTGTGSTPFLFAPPSYAPAYILKSNGHVLSYQTPHGGSHPMIYAALADATAFRDWLNKVAPPKGRLAMS